MTTNMKRPLRLTALALTTALAFPAMAKVPDGTNARLSTLEAQIKAQQEQIAAQNALIRAQQQAIDSLRQRIAVPVILPGNPVTPSEILSPAAGEQSEPIGVQVGRALAATRGMNAAAADRPRLSMTAGRPTFSSSDGRFTLSLRGLAQFDSGAYFQKAQGTLDTDYRRGSVGSTSNRETNAAGDLSSGVNFRRARLGFEGTLERDFGYRLMVELGGSGTEGPARINDAWISWSGLAPFTVQAGAFAPPANMDDGLSPDNQMFLERASAAELSRAMAGSDGRMSLGIKGAGKRWMAALTLTSATVNDAESNDEQLGLVGRTAWLIAADPDDTDYALQIGASGSYVFQPADQGLTTDPRYPFRLRDRPELRLDGTRLIDTGNIDADHASVYGFEAGAQYRNLYLQGEYFRFDVARRDPSLSDPHFTGGYVQGSWVLTGERRRHNMATGSFQNPLPTRSFSPANGGWGAFELAARYSWMDLNYHAGLPGTAAAADAIRGGNQKVVTAGLNWYLNSNLKLLFDYQHVKVDRLNPATLPPPPSTPFGASPATPPPGAQIGQSYDVLSLRSQFAF